MQEYFYENGNQEIECYVDTTVDIEWGEPVLTVDAVHLLSETGGVGAAIYGPNTKADSSLMFLGATIADAFEQDEYAVQIAIEDDPSIEFVPHSNPYESTYRSAA